MQGPVDNMLQHRFQCRHCPLGTSKICNAQSVRCANIVQSAGVSSEQGRARFASLCMLHMATDVNVMTTQKRTSDVHFMHRSLAAG